MKILDVTEFYSERGGGVRSHLALKCQKLCQLGHEHVVVAPGAHDGEETGNEAGRLARVEGSARGGISSLGRRGRVIRVGGPRSPYDSTYHLLTRFDKIAAIVERERPDVLEIHSPYLAALGALRVPRSAFGVRTFQWHSDFIDTYAGVLEAHLAKREGEASALVRLARGGVRPAVLPLWSLVRAIARRSEATLVAAAWQVDKLQRHGVPRVVRVPFGIERDVFRTDARSFEGRRDLLALAGRDARSDAAILVGVGRFAIEKRWDVVLDAFSRVRANGRDAVLVVFGDGPERARMKARAAGSPDVVFPGFSKDRTALAGALASADLFVHGCPFETFGLSVAEAMSSGLPVVVPDEGGAAEMHDAACGERYRSGDAQACAVAIECMLDRLAESAPEVRAAAARAAARLPSVREQFEMQVRLYEELLVARRADSGKDARA